jgi:recombination protein RecA
MYNEGISRIGDALDMAVAQDIVEKRGAFYTYNETRLGQGRENARQFLREHPDLALMIENEVRTAKGLSPVQGC